MSDLPPCREFILFPPKGRAYDDKDLQRAIIGALMERFPGMIFWMFAKGKRTKNFEMLPVLSGIPERPQHRPHYFSPPSEEVMQNIAEVLFEFMPGRKEAGDRPAFKLSRD